jgi:ectoine hydroxylase-related dioxygenase (phytanoyl-CoA dioxygenase family)
MTRVESGMQFSDQQRLFAEEGYAVFPRALDGLLLAMLQEECGRFIQREDARLDAKGADVDGITHRGRRYFAGSCQRIQPRLRQMLFSEALANICRATLGETAYFFYDQFVVKGAENGLPFAWHQDSGYVVGNGGPSDHRPYLTCWCPLDDATAENGTIRLLPFSKVPASRHLVGWEGDDFGVVVEVPAGSIVAFSSLLLHTTGANTTPRLRRAYLAQYTPEVILDPGTRHLRRDAIPFLRDGGQVTFG